MRSALLITSLFISLYAHSFNIATYNIRNFDYDQRMRVATNKPELAKTLKSLNADLIAVQEINKTDIFKNFIAGHLPDYSAALSNCGGAHGQRLGFVYKQTVFKLVDFREDNRTSNPNGDRPFCNDGSRPLAIGHFKHLKTGIEIIAVTVHLKSGGKQSSIAKRFKQLQIVSQVISEYRSQDKENFIVMGDFNSTEFIHIGDNHNKFQKVTEKMGLSNVTQNLGCTSYWWGGRNDRTQYPSQLDHILISHRLVNSHKSVKSSAKGHCAVHRCESTAESEMGIAFDEISDHCPVLVEFQ